MRHEHRAAAGSPPEKPTPRWKRWQKWTVGVVAVLIVLIVIAAVVGGEEETSNEASSDTPARVEPEQNDEPQPEAPAPEPVAEPEPPAPEHFTFGDGDQRVPQDVKPGTYRTREDSPGCYWELLRDFSGGLDSIMANDNAAGPAVMTIPRSAAGFSSGGCAEWTDDLSQVTESKTSFPEGTYIVGTDIAPGSYRSTGGSGCYWARLSGFEGDLNSIIANENASGASIVQIATGDRGFTSKGCGTWTR